VLPSIHWSREYVTTVVAILGTTISPISFSGRPTRKLKR